MRASSASLAPELEQKYRVVDGRPPKPSDRVWRCPMGLPRDSSKGTFELIADLSIVGVRGTQCSLILAPLSGISTSVRPPSHRDIDSRRRTPSFHTPPPPPPPPPRDPRSQAQAQAQAARFRVGNHGMANWCLPLPLVHCCMPHAQRFGRRPTPQSWHENRFGFATVGTAERT